MNDQTPEAGENREVGETICAWFFFLVSVAKLALVLSMGYGMYLDKAPGLLFLVPVVLLVLSAALSVFFAVWALRGFDTAANLAASGWAGVKMIGRRR